jgi:hypothetical protein
MSKSELKRLCTQNPLDADERIAELEQRVKVLVDAAGNLATFIRTKHLCGTDTYKFLDAFDIALNQTPQQTADQIERGHIEWMMKLPPAYDAIYAAWHGAGVDIAGGNWNRFANMLPECVLIPELQEPKE